MAIARGESFHIEEKSEITQNMLIVPRVINGLATDIYHGNAKLKDGDYLMTPTVDVVTNPETNETAPVSLGSPYYDGTEYPRQHPDRFLYICGEEGTLAPWIIFENMGDHGVLDGLGQPITDTQSLQFVRDTLLKIDGALTQYTIEEMSLPNYDPRKRFLSDIEMEIGELATRMAQLDAAKDQIEQGAPLTLDVTITSAWANEGENAVEQSVELADNAQALSGAFEAAIEQFKLVNHRSDVQGNAYVKLGYQGITYAIPSEVWETFFNQRKGSSFEKRALSYAVAGAAKNQQV